MKQNHWSEENYQNVLNDISNEHFWDIVLQDLESSVGTIRVNVTLLRDDTHDDSLDVKTILETLRLLKANSQILINRIVAVETYLLDKQKSDRDSIT